MSAENITPQEIAQVKKMVAEVSTVAIADKRWSEHEAVLLAMFFFRFDRSRASEYVAIARGKQDSDVV